MRQPTRITTPYDRESTAAEVIAGVDLTGRRAIVTGGASGIGIETARALAGAGAQVTLAVRNVEAGQRAAEDIIASTDNGRSSWPRWTWPTGRRSRPSSTWDGPLHILVNNAGTMASPLMRTPEGWEMQFATNHLGHFALATGLHRSLVAAGGARVVAVSSSAHLRSPVVFEDIHFHRREYERWSAYGQSKTGNVLFAVEGTRRWADDGVAVNSLMPGAIRTNLQRYVTEEDLIRARKKSGGDEETFWKTPQQGAAASVLLAASPLVEGVGGRYFEDVNEAERTRPGTRFGVAAYALDPEAAQRLWQLSVEALASPSAGGR